VAMLPAWRDRPHDGVSGAFAGLLAAGDPAAENDLARSRSCRALQRALRAGANVVADDALLVVARGPDRKIRRRCEGHLLGLQPHDLVDPVFTDPSGIPSHFDGFFGHFDDCTKPLPVTLVSGDSLANLPQARYS
jgi:hypothetical protein